LLALHLLFIALFVLTEDLLNTRLREYCYLIIAWPIIAISMKRLHDRDEAGWWLLIAFIPILGVWNLIECGFLPGTRGRNRFGPAPKENTEPQHAADSRR
jgi:uncharacterized membrane protein YhaH (DUF805 family)